MKNGMFKRTASLMIAAALVSGCMPIGEIPGIVQTVSIKASADETQTESEEAVEVSSWSQLKEAIDAEIANPTGKVIKFSDRDSENKWYSSVSPDDPTAADAFFYIPYGAEITIDLNNKSIDRGLSGGVSGDHSKAQESGFVFKNEGTLTLKNTGYAYNSIKGGNNTGNGGAIYNAGVLTLDNVDVEYSSSDGFGGGIYNAGTLTVKSSEISRNLAVNGGGIYNAEGGVLTLYAAELSSNKASGNGGGVYNDCVMSFDGTYDEEHNSYYYNNIRDNNCVGNGAGVYNALNGVINMSFCANVDNNNIIPEIDSYDTTAQENVYLQSGQQINVTKKLVNKYDSYYSESDVGNYRVGVTIAGFTEACTFTQGFGTYNPDGDPYDFFFADSAHKVYDIVTKNGEAGFEVNSWTFIQSQIDAIAATDSHKGEIKLEKDAVFSSKNQYCGTFIIPGGEQYINGNWVTSPEADITIDLNGHTIDAKGRTNIFENGGTLTIKDSTGNNGKITGGFYSGTGGYQGPVVMGGTVIVEGGIITGNTGSGTASAIFGETDVILKGGIITNNSTDPSGGGLIAGSVTVCGAAQFYDNYLTDSEYVYNEETGDSDWVTTYEKRGLEEVAVSGKLEDGAKIDILPKAGFITTDYSKYNTEDPTKFFNVTDNDYTVKLDESSGEAYVCKKSRYITGATLTLDSTFDVNFNYEYGRYDNFRVEYEWGSNSKISTTSSSDFTTVSLAAKEMCDTIHYRIVTDDYDWVYNEETDEEEYVFKGIVLEEGDYCLKTDYLDKLLDKRNTQYSDKDRKMALAAANYGAEAQKMFGYNTDNLANNFTALGSSAYTCDFEAPDLSDVSTEKPYTDCVYNGETVLSYYGTSLLLEDQTVLRQYVRLNDPTDYTNWSLDINGTDGTYDYETYIRLDSYYYSTGYHLGRYKDTNYFYYQTKGLAPQRLLKDHTIHLYNRRSESSYDYELGRRVYKEEIYCTYSPLSYIKLALSDDETKGTALALYQYAKTAEDYLSE